VFSTTASGANVTQGLLDAVTTGPEVLTGGAFGPEASIVSVLVCSVATVLFLRRARATGRIRPRR
jgi:hypothetical protein